MPLTILLVEDDPQSASSLEDILEDKDYRVIRAGDGETALYLATIELPSLILLDVGLPKMDGLEVCRNLKQNETTKQIPVFMLTGADEISQAEKALSLGAKIYITKPYDIPALLQKIQDTLTLSRSKPPSFPEKFR